MKLILVFLMMAFSSLISSAQIIVAGSLQLTDGTFNRPDEGTPPTVLSVVGTAVHYDVIPLNIATAGMVTVSTNSIWDNFAVLYGTAGFNPASPLTNALVAIDDFGGPSAGFTYEFTAPGTYFLVICSFKNNVTGAYSVVASAPIVLPLRLISFSAKKQGATQHLVQWTTAEESELLTYQVQHSTDNKHFTDITGGNFAAKNTVQGASYAFHYNHPVNGYNYYRLKIAENGGKFNYSPVAVMKQVSPGAATIRLYPNPSTDVIKIESRSHRQMTVTVSIISINGTVVNSGEYRLNNDGVLSLNIQQLPAGTYLLKSVIGKEKSTQQFIKK